MTKTIRIADDAPHLMVVDDDRRIRDLLSRFLVDQGFRVTTAADAAEARRRLEGIDFDLLIVDVMMPGETGVSLTQSLRRIKTVPIIMLTALAETNARVEGLEAGRTTTCRNPSTRGNWCCASTTFSGATPRRRRRREQVIFGPFTFSVTRRELRRGPEPIRLTDREQEIMMLFSQRAGETIPATNSSATMPRSANGRSTSRSIGCAARSRMTRPIPSGCRPCAASAIG